MGMLFLSQRPLTRGDVDRDLFVGREGELARLDRAARLGLNVLVLGARGSGVTSLLSQHARQLEDAGQRVGLVGGAAAESLSELATAIRIGVEGRRPPRTQTRQRAPEVVSAFQRYVQAFSEGIDVKTIPGDPDPLAPLRNIERTLSDREPDEGAQEDGTERRLVVILDGTLQPGLVHALFGRLRDEVWELGWTWVVAGRLDRRDEYLEPPADAFFDDEIVLGPLEPEQARQFVLARLADATSEELGDVAGPASCTGPSASRARTGREPRLPISPRSSPGAKERMAVDWRASRVREAGACRRLGLAGSRGRSILNAGREPPATRALGP